MFFGLLKKIINEYLMIDQKKILKLNISIQFLLIFQDFFS